MFASGDSRDVPANTVMDVLRYERDLAALAPDQQDTPLAVTGIAAIFGTDTSAPGRPAVEQKVRSVTVNATYVGTAGDRLPAMDFPNGFTGATRRSRPTPSSILLARLTGGYGLVMLITNRSHSTYHSLQLSAQSSLTHFGLGFQASYTFSKSLDDASAVVGGLSQTSPMNPFDTRADKGPSSFDIAHAATFSLFQDLHADKVRAGAARQDGDAGMAASGNRHVYYRASVHHVFRRSADGWGSAGSDRPDQIGMPDLSTSRTIREDYFGRGANNASFFLIPINVPGGTGPNQGRFGTLGSDTFRGPGFHNIDMALIKDTPLVRRGGNELATLQFRAEFFNVFNLVNFGLPANIVLGPGFGEIAARPALRGRFSFHSS